MWGGGYGISMEIFALALLGSSQSHILIFTFIIAASTIPWGLQLYEHNQKPLSVLAKSYPCTYADGLPHALNSVLITSGLQVEFLEGTQ